MNIAYEAVDRHPADLPLAEPSPRVVLRASAAVRGSSPTRQLKRETDRFANVLSATWGSSGASACSCCRPGAGAVRRCSGHAEARASSHRFPGVRPGAHPATAEPGDARVLVTSPQLYERRIAPIRGDGCPDWSTCCRWGPRDRRDAASRLQASTGAATDSYQTADRPGGHGPAAFHQRHHRHAEGRGPRARGGGRAPRDRRSRSTCDPMTCSGAQPILAGSPAPPTASSRPSPTARRMVTDAADFEARRWYQILASGSRCGTPRPRPSGC